VSYLNFTPSQHSTAQHSTAQHSTAQHTTHTRGALGVLGCLLAHINF
jgi:hypothetical protein